MIYTEDFNITETWNTEKSTRRVLGRREDKKMIIFIIGMIVGSFGSTIFFLFFQGAYKDDYKWKADCDKQYLEQDCKYQEPPS